MRLFDVTLPTAADNLCLTKPCWTKRSRSGSTSRNPRESLRLWQSTQPIVVVGRGSQVEREVRVDYCRQQGIPILRAQAAGAAIVAGPGCLMYALVLSYELRPALACSMRHIGRCSTRSPAPWGRRSGTCGAKAQATCARSTEILRQQRPLQAAQFSISRHAVI